MKKALPLLLTVVVLGWGRSLSHGGQADHVVVVVWDGMRPDYVSAQYTPTLHELARGGTFFQHHHSSYVTSTEVNGTAIATGSYPARSGILANTQYRPELGWLSPYGTEGFDAIRRGDYLTDGHYLGADTLAEILQNAGIPTITAGAKPVVLLQDRASNKTTPAQKLSVTLFRGQTLPRQVLQSLVQIPEIGAFPVDSATPDTKEGRLLKRIKSARDKVLTWWNGQPKTTPLNRQIDAWTTRAVIHGLWKESIPKYTLLWLSEPDASQHQTGAGSPNAEVGLAESDRNLGLVIQALKDRGAFERTDIMVVSDHGFSTVDRGPDVVQALKRAHFTAAKQFENPEAGDIMVVSLGGTVFFYVYDHDAPTVRRLVEFLQGTDFAGVIFSTLPVDGTFELKQIRLDSGQGAPDVVLSMRWTADRNDWGAPGTLTVSEGKRGHGSHASLSRFDVHNTLIAAGPDFKKGFVSDLPSGNIDLAPTILSILGVPSPAPMDGRVLAEALASCDLASPAAEHETWQASRDLGFRVWHQTLSCSRVGSVTYFDEGNGESRIK